MTRLLLPALALAGAVAAASSVVTAAPGPGGGGGGAGVLVRGEEAAAGFDGPAPSVTVPGPAVRGAQPLRPPSSASRPGDRARWRWPVSPRPAVLRPFRAPRSDYGPGHRGLDLGVADGTPVVAVESGVVTHAGDVAGRGTITVAHAGGLRSTYEPLEPAVSAGSEVTVGDLLGTVRSRDGPGHCGARLCLHLGARRGESYLDPFPLLAGGRLALLPLR
jgi:murein DD-endopeptidase MepM/ murein hydrolase activator NlpD